MRQGTHGCMNRVGDVEQSTAGKAGMQEAEQLCGSHVLREAQGLAGISKFTLSSWPIWIVRAASLTSSYSGEPAGSHGSITPPMQMDVFS